MDVKVTIEVILPDGRRLEHSLSVSTTDDLSRRGIVPYWLIIPAEQCGREMVSIVQDALKSPEIADCRLETVKNDD